MSWVNTGGAVSGGATSTGPYASHAEAEAIRLTLATGSTTARALADRFADTLNVKDFGAKGDGVTDDTAAIRAAITAASSSGAHTVDLRGLGNITETITATISLGAADGTPVTIIFDPATKFVPATNALDMFLLLPGAQVEGLTVGVTGVSGYSGKVVKLTGHIYDNQPGVGGVAAGRTTLDRFTLFGSGNTTGTGIHLESTGVTDYVEFCQFSEISISGMLYGIHGIASGAGFVNSNLFTHARCTDSVHGVKMEVVNGGNCSGNNFVGYEYQYFSAGLDAIYLGYTTSGGVGHNVFSAVHIWDFVSGGGRATVRTDAGVGVNIIQGQVDSSLVTDPGGYLQVDDTYTPANLGARTFTTGSLTAPYFNSTTPASGLKFGGSAVALGDGTHTYLKPHNPATGSVYVQTASGTKNAIFDANGCLTVPQSILSLSPGTDGGAGQAGRIFMGSGVPNNANGNNGDVYFRTDTPGVANQRLYNKQAGAWVGIL